jgi:hypothetical protein
MKNLMFVVGALLAAQTSFAADVLTSIVPGSNSCEGITIANQATLNLPSKQVGVSTVAYGLRTKKVAIVNAKVYCLTVMVSEPNTFVKSAAGALSSTDGMTANVLRLDFVRTVDGPTVSQSFADAFTANNVDQSAASVQTFLSAVKNGGQAVSGTAMLIGVDEKTGTIMYQNNTTPAVQVAGDTKLAHAIMAIWLGNPADSGLATLKTQLIGN